MTRLACSLVGAALAVWTVQAYAGADAPSAPSEVSIYPDQVALRGPQAVQQVAATAVFADGNEIDLTHEGQWSSSDELVARVSASGQVRPAGNGRATLTVRWQGHSAQIPVQVSGFETQPAINFANDIVPLFTKLGCNTGGCHGKASGQNGFKLSLLGFEPDFDYDALVKQLRGRRVFPGDPDRSLMLTKPSGVLPHGGGRRIERESAEYQLLRRWIDAGMPEGSADDPKVVAIDVWPQRRRMAPGARQQMIVTAHYSDGSTRDVTALAEYQSNNGDAAMADARGVVEVTSLTGETAVMARYQTSVAVFGAVVPVVAGLGRSWDFTPANFVDQHTSAKWRQLGLAPSDACSDGEFIRRATLDVCGTLPTADEVRTFLADSDPQKRDQLIDRLLDRNEYADYFSLIWADILHNKRQRVELYRYGTYRFRDWIRQQFLHNRPYDEFVRDIVGAQGRIEDHPPAVFHRLIRDVDQYVEHTSQLFLGLQMSCAQCHHHPSEKWTQDDYWGLAAFFGRIGRKKPDEVFDFPPRSEYLFVKRRGEVRQPRTGQVVMPKPLDGPPMQIDADEDPRHRLVDWMTAPENPFFARALVNRYWAHFFGTGLVDPEDDMRVSNPPSNPELLDVLAQEFIRSGFDLKQLVRTICTSRTYQLSSLPNEFNREDQRNYSRYYPKRLSAEVLLDAIGQVTGVATEFEERSSGRAYGRRVAGALPPGTRAVQLPDESVTSYFLDVFGRPPRSTACQCERIGQPSLAQTLTLMNADVIQGKLRRAEGRIGALAADSRPESEKLDEIYLGVHGRLPSAEERQFFGEYLATRSDQKADAYANILWGLLNSEEFQLNH